MSIALTIYDRRNGSETEVDFDSPDELDAYLTACVRTLRDATLETKRQADGSVHAYVRPAENLRRVS